MLLSCKITTFMIVIQNDNEIIIEQKKIQKLLSSVHNYRKACRDFDKKQTSVRGSNKRYA